MLLDQFYRRIKESFILAVSNRAKVRKVDCLCASQIEFTAAREVARLLSMLVLVGVGAAAFAQDVAFPELDDRTGEFLDGLANDDSAKIVELGDFDNDGLEDLVISRTGEEPVLLINVSTVLTNSTGVLMPGAVDAVNSLYVEALDADVDGWTDLVFGRRSQAPWFMQNLGNDAAGNWLGFSQGSAIAGTSDNLVIESGDVNGDGAPDLFAIRVEFGSNDLLLNDGNGNFIADTARLGGLGTLRRGHSALLADVEGDGDTDIIYIESDLQLHIYFNDGNAIFNNTMRRSFRNPDNFAYIFGAGDFNGDGIFDFRQYSNPAPNAEMSDGTFDNLGLPNYTVRVDDNMLRGNRKHGTVHIRDIDSDGDLDYVLSSVLRNFGGVRNTTEGMRTEMVFNRGLNSGEFVTFVGEDWGSDESYDMKVIDINGDGNMDLFVAHQFRYGVYINAAPPQTIEISSDIAAQPTVAGATTQFEISLSSGVPTSYTWEFGDGTTATTANPVVSHTYSTPGRYPVTVTATAPTGADQVSYFQRVHEPLGSGDQVSSMDMVYESRSGNDRVYVVNPDNDTVSVIDAVTNALLAEIPVGDEPRSLALDAGGILCVVNKGDASVSRVDTAALQTVGTFALPHASRPHGIVFDAQQQFAYIALEATGKVVKIDFSNQQTVAELEVGPTPRELSLSADGTTLFAPRFITQPVAGESSRSPALTGGEVMMVDVANLSLLGVIEIPYNLPPNNIDTGVNARGVPNYLRSLALSPTGTMAMLPMKVDNIYRGSMRDGQAREHDMLTRGAMARLDLAGNTEQLTDRFQFDNNSQPTALAFGPTGNYIFVVHEGSRVFEVIDVYANAIIFSDDLGFAPTGVVVSPDGGRVFVHNWLDRSVSIIDSEELMAGTSSNADVIATIDLVANESLAPRVLAGKKLFFDSADLRLAAQKYISCASCHDESGHDGRTWDFSDTGEGLRNTIDLRGRAGVANGNVHWSANFDEIHDFENDIREIFDGTGLLSDADFSASAAPLNADQPKAGRSAALDALAAYTSTLTSFGQSPFRQSDGSHTPTGLDGEAIFVASGCSACHGGDDFTDSPTGVTHNIGTIDDDTGGQLGQPLLNGGLDTPTLKGLWNGAPYLHDGAALTIQDAVLAHTTNIDFNVATLTQGELANLSDYLLQLDDDSVAPQDPALAAALPSTPTASNSSSTVASIVVGGDLNEWPEESFVAADAADSGGASNTLDYAAVYMAHNDANLFVRYANHPPNDVVLTWGYGLYIDIDGEPGYRGFNGELPVGVDYLLEGASLYRYAGSGRDFDWTFVTSVPINLVAESAELSIRRADIGNPVSFRYFLIADSASVGGAARDFFPDAAGDANMPADSRSFAYDFGAQSTAPALVINTPQLYNQTQGVVIDGRDADWARHSSFGDDADDVSGSLNTLDFRQAWMAHNATEFYISWVNDGPAQETWGNGIMLDTDQNTDTGFVGNNSELPIGVDYLLEGRNLFFYSGQGTDFTWTRVGQVGFAFSGDFTEIAIPAQMLGNPPHIDLFFIANNESIGGTAVDFYPDTVTNSSSEQRFFTYTTIEPVQSTGNAPLTPQIDGRLVDWPDGYQAGDVDSTNSNPADVIDWQRALLASDSNNLYIAYETHQPVILNWGYGVYLDTDNNDRTGFKGFANELPLGADYLIEGTSLFKYTGGSQTEWSWVAHNGLTIAADANAAEMAIALPEIGDPASLSVLFRGDNAAVNGSGIDFLPDSGVIRYDIVNSVLSLVDASLVNPVSENTLGARVEEPVAGSVLADAPADVAEPVSSAEGVIVTSGGGAGGSSYWVLALLSLLASLRFAAARLAMPRRLVPVLSIISVVLVSGCDSGQYSGDSTGTGSQSAPNNVPGFDSDPSLGAALAGRQPNNDPSLAWGIEVELSGTELEPPVSTNEGGGFRLFLNANTGLLQGTLQHTLSNAVAATIYAGEAGTNGPQFLPLQSVDSDDGVFEVPAGTFLDAQQQQTLRDGGYYVVVHSASHPGGQLRAQLSNVDQVESVSGNLVSLQLNVFGPICSGCHIGGGTTLPSSMNLSSAGASLSSLVNVRSVEVASLSRVLPGNASASYLVHKIEGRQAVGSQMPFRGPPLTAQQMSAVRDWIDGGALP